MTDYSKGFIEGARLMLKVVKVDRGFGDNEENRLLQLFHDSLKALQEKQEEEEKKHIRKVQKHSEEEEEKKHIRQVQKHSDDLEGCP